MSKSKGNILFQLTGSIACYKACNIISQLVQNGFSVKTICSQNALKFIGKSTLEGLTREIVHTDIFENKNIPGHIELAKWADLAIICPATANILNKLAAGIADDYISSVFLAFDFSKPYLIAPAMNKNMYAHPATQKAIKILKDWKVEVIDTADGHQACGDKGNGRLLEPNEIYKKIAGQLGGKTA
ncbi:MAG: flavoprotein [Elusimicrobiota bacterium]|nr:flavoprotein [Elusimicrobiota bacterium]